LLFTYISTIILSVTPNTAVVASAFILISTGDVLLFCQPIATASDVNSVVLVPPVEYLDTIKYTVRLAFWAFLVKYR